jgi:hypothetical protein
MLYLDYSRQAGQWVPNRFGGRENIEAVAFLRHLNEIVHAEHPGVMMIAEESTSWPAVSRPVYAGGLGFTFKWNMGWMHDVLTYMSKDPVHRHGSTGSSRSRCSTLQRELRPAVQPRRWCTARADDRQDVGRLVAEGRQPARLYAYIRPPGQEAAVHGQRAGFVARVGRRRRAALGLADDAPHAGGGRWSAISTGCIASRRRCTRSTSADRSAGSTATTPRTASSR